MATTFNWIYLGTTTTVLDPTEGNTNAENAGAFVGQTYGSAGDPLYTRITSTTMVNRGGSATALDQNNNVSNDRFTTDIGAGAQTFTFDASVIYDATITYADGTTGTVTMVLVQSTTGQLFLAPEQISSPAPDTGVYEAKPIVSIRLDTITGGVTSYTGLGIDRVVTGFDDGWIDGTTGNDLIDASYVEPIANGSDRVDNGDGLSGAATGWQDDRIRAGAGNDTVLSGLGNDYVDGGTGADYIDGGAGDDSLFGGAGVFNDTILGGAGNDTIDGGDGNDSLLGGDGNDSILGGLGNDYVDGGAGADWIDGGDGDDSLFGGAGVFNDTILGGTGNDTIDGGAGNDSLLGGDGNDSILGGLGNDTVDGSTGADWIDGGDGDDSLFGGDGNDTILGGAGNDTINGGAGVDTLIGGFGSDWFTGIGIGDIVDGSEDGDGSEIDTLDLFGSGWTKATTNIIFDPLNHENGIVQFLDALGNVIGTMTFTNIENLIPCFTPGTMIETDHGPRPVESLEPGARVLTRDNGYQVLRWVGRRELGPAELAARPELRPVLIGRDALGPGLPQRDMLLSPQHRVLLSGPRAELIAGEAEVLAAALHLTDRPGIRRETTARSVSYIHLLFDRHEIIRSDGLWSESFQPGDRTLAGMDRAQRQELLKLFKDLPADPSSAFPAARPTVRRHEAMAILAE